MQIPVGRIPSESTREGTAPPVPALDLDMAPRASPSGVPTLIYVGLAVVPIFLGLLVILARTGILATTGQGRPTPWSLSVLVLCVVLVGLLSAHAVRRTPDLLARARGSGADQGTASWEFGTLAVMTPLSMIAAGSAFVAQAGLLPHPFGGPMAGPILGGIGIVLGASPVAYFAVMRSRRTRAMENRFPDFLRDLNESYSAGMTMAQAIRVSARGDYGALNPEIRIMAHQVSWGAPFTDALRLFSDRVDTPLITRAVSLIIKATAAGGSVKDVLGAAARDAREIEALETDRRNSMRLYVIVIYVSFFVFLGVVAALQGLLVPSLLSSSGGLQGATAGSFAVSGRLTINDFHAIYFGVGIVQSAGSAIVAGVMAEGQISAGLKHMAIMAAITVLMLGILI